MTNHSEDIERLYQQANLASLVRLDEHANMLRCAAALLECHDLTGISLDNWRGPREFVEDMIGHRITENGV